MNELLTIAGTVAAIQMVFAGTANGAQLAGLSLSAA